MRRRFFNNKTGEKIDLSKPYFAIEALEDGLTAKLSANACEYCVDNGEWKTLSKTINTVTINNGQTLSFRGNLTPTLSNGIGTFTISKKCNLKGNVMSLLYSDDFVDKNDLTGKNCAFRYLFSGCTNIVEAHKLILPATTLESNCYYCMFYNCTSLTTAPELPATKLASYCYYSMFSNCSSLTTAPKLPATTLASGCYSNMFDSCRSLETAPALPATTLADNCYEYMFRSCSKLTTAPELPATTLADNCYQNMFRDCTSLTSAPTLPATTLTNYCYSYMFYNCSSLNNIVMLATDISAVNCLSYWVKGVASTGTFVKHPDMNSLPSGNSGIPNGWTVEDYVETNLITFTIDDVEYQAEEGMTWEEWVNSEYDDGKYLVYNDYFIAQFQGTSLVYVFDNTLIVFKSDLVKSNYSYNLQAMGAGN